jgi:hypothetical protein
MADGEVVDRAAVLPSGIVLPGTVLPDTAGISLDFSDPQRSIDLDHASCCPMS